MSTQWNLQCLKFCEDSETSMAETDKDCPWPLDSPRCRWITDITHPIRSYEFHTPPFYQRNLLVFWDRESPHNFNWKHTSTMGVLKNRMGLRNFNQWWPSWMVLDEKLGQCTYPYWVVPHTVPCLPHFERSKTSKMSFYLWVNRHSL